MAEFEFLYLEISKRMKFEGNNVKETLRHLVIV